MIKWFEKHNKLSWTITISIAVLIFYLSSLNFGGVGGGASKNYTAILYHVVIFFLLSIFFFISLVKNKNNYTLFFISIFILISYGAIDELHQSFVMGRFATVLDLVFDSVGVLFASMVYFISLNSRKEVL